MLPMITELTFSGDKFASLSACWATMVCSWVADTFLKAPPNVPKAVRRAATTKTPKNKFQVKKCHKTSDCDLGAKSRIGICEEISLNQPFVIADMIFN